MPDSTTISSASPNQYAALGIAFSLGVLYIVWGSTYLAIKVAVDTIPPYSMLAVRFIVAGGLLYLYLLLRGAPSPTRAEWLGSIRVGILLLVGGMGSVTLAESSLFRGGRRSGFDDASLVRLLCAFLGRACQPL